MNSRTSKLKISLAGLSASLGVALASTYFVSVAVDPSIFVLCLVGVGVFTSMCILDFSRTNSARHLARSKYLISALPLLFFGVWIFFMDTFGYFNWDATLFHLTAGAGVPGVAGNYLVHGFGAIVAVSVLLLALTALRVRGSLSRSLDITLALAALIANPMISGPVKAAAFPSPFKDALATHFVDTSPIIGQQPHGPQRNLIHILLESTERSYFDEARFGDVMASLAAFEARGFSAHNMVEVANTNHSIGGAVASLCGMPFQNDAFVGSGTLAQFQTFLPGLTCLGDVLAANNYDMAYYSGWPIDFLGQGVFYTAHGYSSVYGADEIKEIAPGPGEIFGVDDDQVLRAAFMKLQDLHSNDRPYVLTLGLSGGHAPDGFAAEICDGKIGIDARQPNILHALKCTNMLVADFLNNASSEGMLENTIVVVQSDHLGHESTVSDLLGRDDRRNLFFMFGPGIAPQIHNEVSATIDIFPTLLQVLGYTLDGGHAGVGTSLLTQQNTLVAAEGIEKTNTIIVNDEVLRRQIWRAKPGTAAPEG